MMIRKIFISTILLCWVGISCNNDPAAKNSDRGKKENAENKITVPASGRHYTGIFSNGMKGNKISFNISDDGSRLENLTFQGHWHCAGKLEQTTAGPDGSFAITNNKVDGHISEPPNGGSTAWRFDLLADLNGKEAKGTFRMNINNLGCNTGTLHWTATAE